MRLYFITKQGASYPILAYSEQEAKEVAHDLDATPFSGPHAKPAQIFSVAAREVPR